jgi:hypothetical protein
VIALSRRQWPLSSIALSGVLAGVLSGVLAGVLSGVAALAAGCTGDPYVVDPFPVSVSFANGVPQLYGCAPELQGDCSGPRLVVVLDTGSAITSIDTGVDAGTSPVTRVHTSLDLDAVGPRDAGVDGSVTRARFLGFTAFSQAIGTLGVDGQTPLVDAGVIVGGDRLSTLAVRLDPTQSQLFFFPNIAGADEVLARECKAVIPTTRLGGGDYLIDGAQVGFPATRLVVGTCLNLDANPTREQPAAERRPLRRGADSLLVVATGLPITVLSRSAWKRACEQDRNPGALAVAALAAGKTAAEVCDPEALPQTTMHFPGTPPGAGVSVRLGSLTWIGLAADEVRDQRGPCQEIAASRVMALGGCSKRELACGICPCDSSDTFCRAGASTEVAGPIQVAIVDDTEPILQALRDELRPVVADVDGFLGMNALRSFVTDFDYPGSRLIFRCEDEQSLTCVVRPRLPSLTVRSTLNGCLGKQFFISTATADQLPSAGVDECPSPAP